jgi:hypothetical protein
MESFMRRIIQLSVACLAAGAVSACSGRDAVTETGVSPTGGVRFINAVPDTAGSAGLDFRFVDIVENNAHYAIPFRNNIVTSGGVPASTQIQFKATAAGAARHFRIFLDDSLTSVAQLRVGCSATATTCVGDSTMAVENGHRYTALLWGNARGGATPMKLTIIDEACAPTDTTQIGLRIINATTNTTVDVRQYTGSTVPATATWAGIAPMTISSCVYVPTSTGIKFNVRTSGSATNYVTADGTALIGVPNGTQANGCLVGTDCDATPGTTAAGSVITAVIFGPSVAGSKAAQFSSPAMTFMWDRRPNRNGGT